MLHVRLTRFYCRFWGVPVKLRYGTCGFAEFECSGKCVASFLAEPLGPDTHLLPSKQMTAELTMWIDFSGEQLRHHLINPNVALKPCLVAINSQGGVYALPTTVGTVPVSVVIFVLSPFNSRNCLRTT